MLPYTLKSPFFFREGLVIH